MNPKRAQFLRRCDEFAAGVLRFTVLFPKDSAGRHLADQLLRSGTSIGANVHEAQSAQSRADFVSKMQIALKEARETNYWLQLLKASNYSQDPALDLLAGEAPQLAAILAQSVITAKANGGTSKENRK